MFFSSWVRKKWKGFFMSRPTIKMFILVFFLILAGCEGGGNGGEDPVVPSGITDPVDLTQRAFQKQEIGAYEEAGIELQHLLIGGDGVLAPVPFLVDRTHPVMGGDEFGIDLQRLV